MKKILITFLFLTSCSMVVGQEIKKAQANAVSVTNTAVVQEISQTISLDESLSKDFVTLLGMRDEALENAKSSEEKKAICERIASKFISALTPKQLETLKAKPDLYKKLILDSGK